MMCIYEPPHYIGTVRCMECNTPILPKNVMFLESNDLQPLYRGDITYSLRCASCGLDEYYINRLRGDLSKMATQDAQDPAKERQKLPLIEILNAVVRYELKKILKEESADPNGPFSPAP